MQNTEKFFTRLILVRHGQTLANAQHFLQGISNGTLTKLGKEQVEDLGSHLRNFQIDHIISSDLIRAHDTAKAIAKHHNLSVETLELIREWNCGIWDGRPVDEFLSMLEQSGKPVSSFSPEGGERLDQVRDRAASFLSIIMDRHKGKTVVVTSHGDFLRAFVSCLLEINVDQANKITFNNCSYSLFEHNGRSWRAIAINRLPNPRWESF